jgi:hypothetical protein
MGENERLGTGESKELQHCFTYDRSLLGPNYLALWNLKINLFVELIKIQAAPNQRNLDPGFCESVGLVRLISCALKSLVLFVLIYLFFKWGDSTFGCHLYKLYYQNLWIFNVIWEIGTKTIRCLFGNLNLCFWGRLTSSAVFSFAVIISNIFDCLIWQDSANWVHDFWLHHNLVEFRAIWQESVLLSLQLIWFNLEKKAQVCIN